MLFTALQFIGFVSGTFPYEVKAFYWLHSQFADKIISCNGDTIVLPEGYFLNKKFDKEDGFYKLGFYAGPFNVVFIVCKDTNFTKADVQRMLDKDYVGVIRGSIMRKSYVFTSGPDTIYATNTIGNARKGIGIVYYTDFYLPNRNLMFDFARTEYDVYGALNDLKQILYNNPKRTIDFNSALTDEINK
jgi:hypothetical protein